MASGRRQLSAFNLSFLDIMFCGFGAVALLVLIVNSHTVSRRNERHADLRAEVSRMEREVTAGERLLAELTNSMNRLDAQITEANGRSEIVLNKISRTKKELARYTEKSLAEKDSINKLQSDLKSMEEEKRQLAAIKAQQKDGNKVREFVGQGERQYLTGLKLGGERVLLLVDTSASMLDTTIVNIIRRRIARPEQRRAAPKWQQAVRTVEWLLANLPPEASLRIVSFNDKAAAIGPSAGKWVAAGNTGEVDAMVAALRALAPEGGTSLQNAFGLAASLRPKPDNILLITDGLPTMGARPGGKTVSPEQRVKFFEQAKNTLPQGVPVNTILFPMEGDPLAAALYWKLAVTSNGSFLTPSSDWP